MRSRRALRQAVVLLSEPKSVAALVAGTILRLLPPVPVWMTFGNLVEVLTKPLVDRIRLVGEACKQGEKGAYVMAEEQDVNEQQLGMVSSVGPVEIDWPRTIGYYGGVSLALAFELIEPPLAIFIAAIPLLKMLNHPGASQPTRFVGQVLDGAARPVGGSAESTIQLTTTKKARARRSSLLGEARQIASQMAQRRLRAATELSH